MSVIDKIKAGDYNNRLPYPASAEPMFNGVKIADMTPAMRNAMTVGQLQKAKDDAMAAVRDGRKAYHDENARLTAALKSDLEAEYGFADHPKRDVLWSLAWSYGHSMGMHEVAIHYEELSALLV